MATIGLDKLYYAKITEDADGNETYATPVQLAKAISAENPDKEQLAQALANLFYMIRITAVLLHPMAPFGTEKLREYLQVDERIWSWDTLHEPLTFFVGNGHKLKFLPPRTDFFTRHESQFESKDE